MSPSVPLILSFGMATLWSQDLPDARILLDQAANVIRSGPTYRARFAGSLEMKATGLQQIAEFSGSILWQPPDKARIEAKVGPSDLFVVRNGTDTWTYLSVTKQYRKTSGAAGIDGSAQDAGQLLASDIVLNGLESARIEGEENVSVGGETHRCYVVVATYHKDSDGGATPAVKFWIDEKSQILLRRRATADLRSPRLEQPVETTVDMTLIDLQLSPPLTGGEFVFVPPDGSSEQTNGASAGTPVSGSGKELGPPAASPRASTSDNNLISPPTILSKAEPVYSAEATLLRLEGMVPISVIVERDGAPSNIEVKKSLGFGLDEAAVDAVRKWRFNPGLKNGEPVPVKATIEVNFRFLAPKDAWLVRSAVFETADGASVPHLKDATFPGDAPSGAPCSATLTIQLDKRGTPGEIRVAALSEKRCEVDLVAAIRKWRFQPATKDGVSVASSLTMELSQ